MAASTDTLERETKLQGMGSSRLRKEDARFIRGRGTYVDDIKLPGMLFGAIVRSPYAHARIKSINKAKALAVPGVVAVLTADDLKPVKLHWMPTLGGDVQAVLADKKVCFQMQEVAMVIASDRYSAADGADAVEVDYEELPAIVDPHKSMAPGAPDHSRRHRRQGRSRSRQAHAPQSHLHLGSGRQGRHRCGVRQRRGDRPRRDPEPARASVSAGDLRLRGLVRQGHGPVDGLHDVAGAAPGAHRRRDAFGHSRKQDPHHRRRHRRRLRQQGAGLSGLCRRHRRVDRDRRADQVDRVAHRQHLHDRIRARLSRRRRTGGRQGRPHQGAALYRAGRSRRVQFARLGHQAAGRPVQHLHRLLRHSQGLLPGRCGLYQQGARRRGLSLFAAGHRGGVPDRAHDRRAGAEARPRQGRDPPAQLRQGGQVSVHHGARLDARQRQLPRRAGKGVEGGGLRRPAQGAGRKAGQGRADGHRHLHLHRDRRRRTHQGLRHPRHRAVRQLRHPRQSHRQRHRAAGHDEPGPGPRDDLRADHRHRAGPVVGRDPDRGRRHRQGALRRGHLGLALHAGRRRRRGDGRAQDPREGAKDRGAPAGGGRRRPRMGGRPLQGQGQPEPRPRP